MKPLTIEQLKALQVGDWVWIEILEPESIEESFPKKAYFQKADIVVGENFFPFILNDCEDGLDYQFYGSDWLAYKNKEQAEAKGEIVEFPCKVRDKAWYVVDRGKLSKIEETYVKHIVIYAWGFEVEFEDTGRHLTFNSDGTIENSFNIYLDKSESERRLAELTKE